MSNLVLNTDAIDGRPPGDVLDALCENCSVVCLGWFYAVCSLLKQLTWLQHDK